MEIPVDLRLQEKIIRGRLREYGKLAKAVRVGNKPDRIPYLRQKYSKVVPNAMRALEKIAEGELAYRTCDRCRNLIDAERLILIPAAIHCLACQTTIESSSL